MNHLEKSKIKRDSLKKKKKEFIRNKSTLKPAKFKTDMHNAFTEEFNKIAFEFKWW